MEFELRPEGGRPAVPSERAFLQLVGPLQWLLLLVVVVVAC